MDNEIIDDDDIVFADEDDEISISEKENSKTGIFSKRKPWKIIIADDDEDIHFLTKMVMEDYLLDNREVEFISAFSGKETMELIREHTDTALILLDIVMETEDAGLKVIKYIRETLNNSLVRIILRTGQPGKAPEKKIIIKYDINDYKEKTELTTQKLFTTVTTSLRSFRDLQIKEVLLKDNHFRVNNTLQIISSMLRIQSRYIDNKQAREIFKESQNRIETMALIHEKLYSSQNLEEINFANFVRNLTSNLVSSYEINEKQINININTDNIYLPVDLGTSCGLIINELISNTFKQITPEGKGDYNIDLHSKDDGYQILLYSKISDFEEDIDLNDPKQLSLQFVNELVNQINGQIDLDTSNGVRFIINFWKQ